MTYLALCAMCFYVIIQHIFFGFNNYFERVYIMIGTIEEIPEEAEGMIDIGVLILTTVLFFTAPFVLMRILRK